MRAEGGRARASRPRGDAHLIGSSLDVRGDVARAPGEDACRRRAAAGELGGADRPRAGSARLSRRERHPRRAARCRAARRSCVVDLSTAPRRSTGSPTRWALALSASAAPPSARAAATRSRLAELVIVEALRRYVYRLPPGGKRMARRIERPLRGARARARARAASEPWTVERLGRQVGLSRSALAERLRRGDGRADLRVPHALAAADGRRNSPPPRRAHRDRSHEAGYESAGASRPHSSASRKAPPGEGIGAGSRKPSGTDDCERAP